MLFFFIFLPHYGNEERADLTTEQPDELHFHGLSRLLVTLHCLFSFSVYFVKNCDNKKRLLLLLPSWEIWDTSLEFAEACSIC